MWIQPEITLPDEVMKTASNSPFSDVSINAHAGAAMPFNSSNNTTIPLGGLGPGPGPVAGMGGGSGMMEGGGGVGLGSSNVVPQPQPNGPPGFLFEIESHVSTFPFFFFRT